MIPLASARPEGSLQRFRWMRPLGVPLIALAIGVVALLMAGSIPDSTIPTAFDPRWWPEALATLLITLSVGGALFHLLNRNKAVFTPTPDTESVTWSIRRLAAVLGSTFGYVLVWQVIGYTIATALFCIGVVAILGGRGWRALMLFPAIVTILLVLFFDLLLGVPL